MFRFTVEKASAIRGRGTMVTGKIENGRVRAGEPVEIVQALGNTVPSTVTAVLIADKVVEEARAGDSCGLLLRGVEESDVGRGTVLRSAKT